jgi:hypothetical protein
MNRSGFEHVIKAAAAVVDDELVVVGSQAVLAHDPNPPAAILTSMELDVYPRNQPERADEIDGSLGDGSRFHETYGYYAHGVGPETVIAPTGWEDRLVRLELPAIRRTDGSVIAWCLSMDDLVLAKLAAGRAHDLEFAQEAIKAGLVDPDQLQLGVELMPTQHRDAVRERLAGIVARVGRA